MYFVVTGAAGFIGANIVKALNNRGVSNIIAVDNLSRADKFINLVDCEIADYLDKEEFIAMIHSGHFDGAIEAVFHQGACSDTMEADGRYMMENNFRYSVSLLDFCLDHESSFLYASSAAVYGAGPIFKEERQYEAPLNVYGYSKFLFDQIVRQRLDNSHFVSPASQVAGFRYFNVYGPREQHKGRMASVAFHHYKQYRETGKVKLFQGCDGYADGEQSRDFVYIDDVVKVNMFFLDRPDKSGIFNLGTGRAQPFNDVAEASVNACRAQQQQAAISLAEMVEQGIVEYIEFPAALKGKYQSYTQADIERLRDVGYHDDFADVATGIASYIECLQQK